MLLLYWCFVGLWGFILIMGWYEYGEHAKLTTVIIYYISYYWVAFAPIQIPIVTIASIFLRKKQNIGWSIVVQVLPFILLFFAIIMVGYLI